MINRRTFVGAAILLPFAGCTSTLSELPPIASAEDATYRLGPGDEIKVSVFGFDQMANVYTVSDAGTISLPLLRTIEVTDHSAPELEGKLAALLREQELAPNANVSVQVQKYRPFYILGEVRRAGQYAYVPGMTLTVAVAIAGGYTFRANTKAATITRATRGSRRKGKAGPDTLVLPGDTIEVPEAWF